MKERRFVMGVFDKVLKKFKMVPEDDEYDEYDEFSEESEAGQEVKTKKAKKPKKTREESFAEEDEGSSYGAYSNPGKVSEEPSQRPSSAYSNKDNVKVFSMNGKSQKGNTDVCMIMPRSFDDATTIADMLLEYKAVVLNMEGIDMAAAQRLIDFASGACYTVGGNLQKISKKIFMIVPQNMNLSGDFDQLMGDMVDLNALGSQR